MKKVIIYFLIICLIIFILLLFCLRFNHKEDVSSDIGVIKEIYENKVNDANINTAKQNIRVIMNPSYNENITVNDWRLTLVNHDNLLPENFEIELANIDKTRKFDARAINYLLDMMKAMKKDGVYDVWIQSAYRDPNYQDDLYNQKVQEYIKMGISEEEAEDLANQEINKPWTSEHNLGLAVDFNYVNTDFEKTKAFSWLQENAEQYGFILRYKKEKENITKIVYEPWHWRFVGEENAMKMNDLDMCLEEYIEYINNN